MFAHWTDTLPAHRLDVVHRFTEPWQAEASLAHRRGDPGAAHAYAEHGRVPTAHPALVAERIAHIHKNAAGRGQTVALTAHTTSTAPATNPDKQRPNNNQNTNGK